VRTAATELRKRLIAYYADDRHRAELQIGLVPGSYIPRFALPDHARQAAVEPATATEPGGGQGDISHFRAAARQGEWLAARKAGTGSRRWPWVAGFIAMAAVGLGYGWLHRASPQDLFWKPVLDTPGPVLLAVGDHPNGPPTLPESAVSGGVPTPIPGSDASETVPFADTVTVAQVVAALEERNKQVLIRRGNSSSFSDLREGAVVLVGAFNNEWSLRLTRQLRYSLDLDPERHLICIRDAKNPSSRSWIAPISLCLHDRGHRSRSGGFRLGAL
jgi:hypothetical protein